MAPVDDDQPDTDALSAYHDLLAPPAVGFDWVPAPRPWRTLFRALVAAAIVGACGWELHLRPIWAVAGSPAVTAELVPTADREPPALGVRVRKLADPALRRALDGPAAPLPEWNPPRNTRSVVRDVSE